MDNLSVLGRWLVLGGVIMVITGALVWAAGRWLGSGQLPGTIRVQTGGLTCVFPLLASVVLSIILTLVLNLAARLFK